jgi:hypothetical protein
MPHGGSRRFGRARRKEHGMLTLVLAILLVCGPAGDAHDAAHAALNRLKNRATAPTSYKSIAFSDFVAARVPSGGVELDGWVIAVKRAGVESCGCHRMDLRDLHVDLGPRPGAAKSECVIIEITPRWQARVAAPAVGAHVRVYGWPMLDRFHEKGAVAWRATAEEIHPTTKIETIP